MTTTQLIRLICITDGDFKKVQVGAEYATFCAETILKILDQSNPVTVWEIETVKLEPGEEMLLCRHK